METENQWWSELVEKLTKECALNELKGEVNAEFFGLKIYLLNFAISETYIQVTPVYLKFRERIYTIINEIMTDEKIFDKPERIAELQTDFFTNFLTLLYICTNQKKTDINLIMKKLRGTFEESYQKGMENVLNLLYVVDYSIWRGQTLLNILADALESKNVEKMIELNDKNILPYKLEIFTGNTQQDIANHIRSLLEKVFEENNAKNEPVIYDLSKMNTIGEA